MYYTSGWWCTYIPADEHEITLIGWIIRNFSPDALSRIISCAVKDTKFSGLCSETKECQKGRYSFVNDDVSVWILYFSSPIQRLLNPFLVVSLGLRDWFCTYFIFTPKGPEGYWVPILANSDIVERYFENVVDELEEPVTYSWRSLLVCPDVPHFSQQKDDVCCTMCVVLLLVICTLV